jgi:hypothetical protein
MPEADTIPVIGFSKARIQGSKENTAACISYASGTPKTTIWNAGAASINQKD